MLEIRPSVFLVALSLKYEKAADGYLTRMQNQAVADAKRKNRNTTLDSNLLHEPTLHSRIKKKGKRGSNRIARFADVNHATAKHRFNSNGDDLYTPDHQQDSLLHSQQNGPAVT
jgi:hypothetical protein